MMTQQARHAFFEVSRTFENLLGKMPTYGLVSKTTRKLGFAFCDADGKRLHAKLRAARSGGATPSLPERSARAPQIEHECSLPAPDAHLSRSDDAGASRAGDKVSSVTSSSRESHADANRGKPSLSMEFGSWFFEAGLEKGAIDKHRRNQVKAIGYAYTQHPFAESLVAEYGIERCKRAAERLFARCTLPQSDHRRIRKEASVQLLADWWRQLDDPAPAGNVVPGPGSPHFASATSNKALARYEALKQREAQ